MSETSHESSLENLFVGLTDTVKPKAPTLIEALAVILFLRWLDVRDTEREAVAASRGLPYQPLLPAPLLWRQWHSLPPQDLTKFLSAALPAEFERSQLGSGTSLGSYLSALIPALRELARFSATDLARLCSWVADQPFDTPVARLHLLRRIDSLIRKFVLLHDKGAATSHSVNDLMVTIAAPHFGERVYDPAFGMAELLTTAISAVELSNNDQPTTPYASPLLISGAETNASKYVVALTRLVLAGIDEPSIKLGTVLAEPYDSRSGMDTVDIVLMRPPIGTRHEGRIPATYPVSMSDTSGLLIQHALSKLRPGGRAVILVSQAMLSRGGREQKLRQWLLQEHTIKAVVSLPPGSLGPHVSVATAILIVQRGGQTGTIRMVFADPFFQAARRGQTTAIDAVALRDLATAITAVTPTKNGWNVAASDLENVGWDLTPRRDSSHLLDILKLLRDHIPIVALKECCTVIPGRPYKWNAAAPPWSPDRAQADEFLSPERTFVASPRDVPSPLATGIPLVRIRDLHRGFVDKPTARIPNYFSEAVSDELFLRKGDVLLSRSGAIGKVGLVRTGAIGAVPSSGLLLVRPNDERLMPEFLEAYLSSRECRTWLSSRSRGAIIQSLSVQSLRELPIPVPPLDIQLEVNSERRHSGQDGLVSLTRCLTKTEPDLVTEWIAEAAAQLPGPADISQTPLDLVLLSRLAAGAQSLRDRIAHERLSPSGRPAESKGASHQWFTAFADAIAGLVHAMRNDRGPSYYRLLSEAEWSLSTVLQMKPPPAARAQLLAETVRSWIGREILRLSSDVRIRLTAEDKLIFAKERTEITLYIQNDSPLPVRDFMIFTRPNWGEGDFDYFPEHSTKHITLSATSDVTVGPVSVLVSWVCNSYGGITFEGDMEIAFPIALRHAPDDTAVAHLGGSPYVCGDPIRPDRNDIFFGRGDLIQQIRRQVTVSGNVILLEGNRRAGKTSILRHLEGARTIPGWLSVYCSLQGAEGANRIGVPTAEIFREIATSVAKGLLSLEIATPLPNGTVAHAGTKLGLARACHEGIGEQTPFNDFREYLELVLDVLRQHALGLLLMLDEFDKLQQGIDSQVTSPQVPENLRFLVQTYPRFSAILTGSRRLKRLREEYWSALFGLGTRFGVSALSDEAAHHLVTEPVKDRLTYSREAVERAVALTARQPYLLQCLCSRIYDLAAQEDVRSITVDIVRRAANILVEDNEHLASLWDYSNTDRRRLLLALFAKSGTENIPLRFGMIQEMLAEKAIEVDDESLVADLDFLRELEVVELFHQGGADFYRLALPLFAMWIDRQQDVSAITVKARLQTEDDHE